MTRRSSLATPHDPEAEASLIATCAAPGGFSELGSAQAIATLDPAQMLVPRHRAIWAAVRAIWADGGECNALVLRDWLQAHGTLDQAGGFLGLTETLAAPEVGRPAVLAAIIASHWRRRQWLRIAAACTDHAQDLTFQEPDIAAELAEGIRSVQATGQASKRRNVAELVDQLEAGEPFDTTPGAGQPMYAFGLDVLDRVLHRSAGHVVLVAARPGVGKTSLMVNGFGKSLLRGFKGLFVSLELSEGELKARIASRVFSASRIGRHGHTASPEVVRKAQGLRETLSNGSHLCLPSLTPWGVIESEIRAAVLHDKITSVWIDYFTLIGRPAGQKGQTDAALWGQLSTQIRSFAQQMGISIVLASQLNRGTTEYEEPSMSDLRDTGQLEQDAHGIIMIWKGKENGTEFPYLKLTKNRDGATVHKTRMQCDYSTHTWDPQAHETNPGDQYGTFGDARWL